MGLEFSRLLSFLIRFAVCVCVCVNWEGRSNGCSSEKDGEQDEIAWKITHNFLANQGPKGYRISGVHPSEKSGCKELRSAKSQPVVFGHLNTKRHVVRPRENSHVTLCNCRYKQVYFNALSTTFTPSKFQLQPCAAKRRFGQRRTTYTTVFL